jgi:transposase InsO family protein
MAGRFGCSLWSISAVAKVRYWAWAFSLTGRDVVAALERTTAVTGLSVSITVDHGTGFMSKALEAWAFYRGVKLALTRPGNPRITLDEHLNRHQFL